MKVKPLISVIINCHNGEKYLSKCVKSVLNQYYKNFEIIFWDNCSTDKSRDIINKFKDKRIKKFFSKNFCKLYEARNLAIKKTKGLYISFLDVDDLWRKDKLSQQINLLKRNKKLKIIYSNYIFYNEKKRNRFVRYDKKLPSGYITQNLLNDYIIGLNTTLVQKNLFKKFKFNSSYDIIGDFDFFLRASVKNIIMSIQKPLAIYRSHENNLSQKKLEVYYNELSNWIIKVKKDKIFKRYNFSNIKKFLFFLKIKLIFSKYLNINLGV